MFIVYPEAIATMTGSVFWSIIFFLMLITLGLDSTFGGLEAMITALCDEYPRLLGRHREIFVAVVLVLVYVCSLPTCTYVSRGWARRGPGGLVPRWPSSPGASRRPGRRPASHSVTQWSGREDLHPPPSPRPATVLPHLPPPSPELRVLLSDSASPPAPREGIARPQPVEVHPLEIERNESKFGRK